MNNYLYDSNNIRCNLIQTNGAKAINWLFVPGGAGIDSRYLKGLVANLELPGNVWLIDLPGNGDHTLNVDPNYDYDLWFDIFKDLVERFDNPVLVGHSFGGMLGLLIPELENKLLGFVALNSSPSLWMEVAAKAAKEVNKPDLTQEMTAFVQNPCQDTFATALEACFPYYFHATGIQQGAALFADLPFPYKAAVWCQNKLVGMNYSAKWFPKTLPMLIVSGTEDYICHYSLFKNDVRFQGSNVTFKLIAGAGHFPWLEQPHEVSKAFAEFINKI
jgi:pimeloyl-ACP methyl ester carboxylesterase